MKTVFWFWFMWQCEASWDDSEAVKRYTKFAYSSFFNTKNNKQMHLTSK